MYLVVVEDAFFAWFRRNSHSAHCMLPSHCSLMMQRQMMTLTTFWTNQRVYNQSLPVEHCWASDNIKQSIPHSAPDLGGSHTQKRSEHPSFQARSQSVQVGWADADISRPIETTFCCSTFSHEITAEEFWALVASLKPLAHHISMHLLLSTFENLSSTLEVSWFMHGFEQ